MASLKLARIADRTPVKLSIALLPALHDALVDYGKLYAADYGQTEPVAELVPAMLAAFLESDREFLRRRSKTQGAS